MTKRGRREYVKKLLKVEKIGHILKDEVLVSDILKLKTEKYR